jgi:hypothetical protein
VDRRQLLQRLDRAWRDFQESHADLSETQMMKSGVTGNWSVRDILAHVTTWGEEALNHLPSSSREIVTEQKKRLSLSEVLRQMTLLTGY